MKTRLLMLMLTMVTLSHTASLQAHHSSSMLETSSAFWLQGRVVATRFANPHVFITLEVMTDDAGVEIWTIEGPRLGRFEQLGVNQRFLNSGDVIEVCAFHFKEGLQMRRGVLDDSEDGIRGQFVHGRVLVLASGQAWLWGAYGRLEQCVNPQQWDSILRGALPLPPL